MRPLLTYDKSETVRLAKKIGSYEISIQPYDDCCSLFLPKNPATRGRLNVIRQAEDCLAVDELVDVALENTQVVKFT